MLQVEVRAMEVLQRAGKGKLARQLRHQVLTIQLKENMLQIHARITRYMFWTKPN